MSILTKVSVVVLLVLILLACPVFITQATVHPNYRIAFEKEVLRAQINELAARHAQLAEKRALKLYTDAEDKARTQIDQSTVQINALQAQLNTEKLEKTNLANRIDTLNVTAADLQKNLEAAVAQNKALDAQLNGTADQKGARQIIAVLQEELRKTEALLQTAQADVERVTRIWKVKDEDIANLRAEVTDLNLKIEDIRRNQIAGAAGGQPGVTPAADIKPAVDVTGTVIAVREPDLASINIGSAKGITPGMTLIVYRGSSFVAHLKIAEVDLNNAAGIIVDRKLDPMQGDKVTSKLK